MATINNLTTTFTVDENQTVRFDTDVIIGGTDAEIKTSRLTITGLLAEDRIGFFADSSITLSGQNVLYNGTTIGRYTGGTGTDFTVYFNANATLANVDAMVEHLTYGSVSDTPTPSRALNISLLGADTFQTASSRLSDQGSFATVAIGDVNGDGRQDIVTAALDDSGNGNFVFRAYAQGTGGAYTLLSGSSDPFTNLNLGTNNANDGPSFKVSGAMAFADLYGDSRPELVVNSSDPSFDGTYLETYTLVNGKYVSLTSQGLTDPLKTVTKQTMSLGAVFHAFGDFDGDGDLDLAVTSQKAGVGYGLNLFRNDNGVFTPAGFIVSPSPSDTSVRPAADDIDNDGDVDLVVSAPSTTQLYVYKNNGSSTLSASSFAAAQATSIFATTSGNHNEPVSGTPSTVAAFGDIDGDGDRDVVYANGDGTLAAQTRLAGTADRHVATANVTPIDDAPTVANIAGDAAAYTQRNAAVALDVGGNATVSDIDSTHFNGGSLTVRARTSANVVANDDQLLLKAGNGITLSGSTVLYNGTAIGTVSGGAGGTDLVIAFTSTAATPAATQALLRDLYYDNVDVATTGGTRTVTYTLVDGPAGSASATFTSTVAVTAVNAAPVNTVPASITTSEDAPVPISGLSVSDEEGGNLTVSLSVTHGALSFGSTAGLTFTNAAGDASTSFSGSQAAINNALAGLIYRPDANYFGSDTLAVSTNDGSITTTNSTTITVTPVADTPTVTGATTAEDTQSASGLVVTRNAADGAEVGYVKITGITNGTLYQANGTTAIANGSFLTYAQANAGLKFTPTADFNGNGTFQVQASTSASDAGLGGSVVTATVAVTPVNDAPVVNASGTTAFVEGADVASTPVAIAPAIFVNDVDNTTLASASVAIVGNFAAGDTLGFTANATAYGNIAGSYNAGTGVLTLTSAGATATLAQFQAALSAVSFVTQSDTPSTLDRTIRFTVNDGTANTNSATTDHIVTVTASNDSPINTVPAAQTGTEDTAKVFSSAGGNAIAVSDPDAGSGNLQVTVGVAHGALTLSRTTGLVFSTGDGTGDATMTFQGTQANINAALNGLSYTPTANYNGTDTLTITTNDLGNSGTGGAKSDTDTVMIGITAVNDAPVVVAGSGTAAFVEGNNTVSTPVAVAPALTVSDVDNTTLLGASVQITGGFESTDRLLFSNTNATTFGNITASYNVATGTLQMASAGAIATLAQFQAALQAVTFTSLSENPSAATRTISVFVNDGSASSAIVTRQVIVTPVNDTPVIDLNGTGTTGIDTTLAYTEGAYTATGGYVQVAPNAAVFDVDAASYAGAILRIGIASRLAQDAFAIFANPYDAASTTHTGLEIQQTTATGGNVYYNGTVIAGFDLATDAVVTFNANASQPLVQAVAQSIGYANTSDAPVASRTMTFAFSADGQAATTAQATIAIQATNDAPTLTAPTAATFTEGGAPLALFAGTVLADPDLPSSFAAGGLSVALSTGSGGSLVLGADTRFTAASGALFFQGSAIGTISGLGTETINIGFASGVTQTIAQALVNDFAYANASHTPGAGNYTATLTFNDGGNSGSGGALTGSVAQALTVVAVDDAPVALPDTAMVAENGMRTIAVVGNDTDIDGGPKFVATINGTAVALGQSVTLASGAIATLNADGTVGYDPHGAYNYLVSAATAAATGAINSSAIDTFTYALNGGSTASVSVLVTGVDGTGDHLVAGPTTPSLAGTPQPDYFDLSQAGVISLNGGGGDDGFYFGATLTAADQIDGGAGSNDQVGLMGDYTGAKALVLAANTLTNVEVLAFMPGGTSPHSYDVTSDDATVAAGQVFKVFATNLAAGENLTFNGAAETDGSFLMFGGKGTDTLTGGAQSDGFYFGQDRLGASDVVHGGAGIDQVGLDGHSGAMLVDSAHLDVEVLALLNGGGSGPVNTYGTITVDDSWVAAGQTKTITAVTAFTSAGVPNSAGPVSTALVIDGSGEHDGNLNIFGGTAGDTITGGDGNDRLYGGMGADTLRGGAGADTFYYNSAAESTGLDFDTLPDFTFGTDKLSIAGQGSDVYTSVTGGALNRASFEADLQAAVGGQLSSGHAVVFTASSGDFAGQTFLVVDADGSAGYHTGGDYVFHIDTQPVVPAATADFIIA